MVTVPDDVWQDEANEAAAHPDDRRETYDDINQENHYIPEILELREEDFNRKLILFIGC